MLPKRRRAAGAVKNVTKRGFQSKTESWARQTAECRQELKIPTSKAPRSRSIALIGLWLLRPGRQTGVHTCGQCSCCQLRRVQPALGSNKCCVYTTGASRCRTFGRACARAETPACSHSLVEQLLAAIADANTKGDLGADANIKRDFGNTPLHLAAAAKCPLGPARVALCAL